MSNPRWLPPGALTTLLQEPLCPRSNTHWGMRGWAWCDGAHRGAHGQVEETHRNKELHWKERQVTWEDKGRLCRGRSELSPENDQRFSNKGKRNKYIQAKGTGVPSQKHEAAWRVEGSEPDLPERMECGHLAAWRDVRGERGQGGGNPLRLRGRAEKWGWLLVTDRERAAKVRKGRVCLERSVLEEECGSLWTWDVEAGRWGGGLLQERWRQDGFLSKEGTERKL